MNKINISRRNFITGSIFSILGLAVLGNTSCNSKITKEINKDILIVGAGGAGLASALSAYEQGKTDIAIIEKMDSVGGNTNKASSGMNACCTEAQKKLGINDSVELFVNDTFIGGHKKGDIKLIEHLCKGSTGIYSWLKKYGLDLNSVTKTAGSSVPRCHRPSNNSPVGAALIKTLHAKCKEFNIDILTSNKAVSLIEENNKIVGCVVENENHEQIKYNTKCVILASGGFGSNKEWIAKYANNGSVIKNFPTTNQDGATGDGISLGINVGAGTEDMEEVQTHPTVHPDTHVLIGESMRAAGSIMINFDGNRFYNEEALRDVLSDEELRQPQGCAWLVFDENIHTKEQFNCSYYESRDMIIKGATIEELANNCDVDFHNCKNSIDSWNNAIKKMGEDAFGRPISYSFNLWKAPYYAIKITPGIHHTMGGLKVNENANVLRSDGSIIEGLLACGEVTGDLHGGNRLGGNAICDVLVNGLTAGSTASIS